MDQITTVANAIIKLDETTEKNVNEDRNVAELVEKFRSLHSRTCLLQVAMQKEISSVIGTSNNTDGHSSLSEFFKNILRHSDALKSIALEQGT